MSASNMWNSDARRRVAQFFCFLNARIKNPCFLEGKVFRDSLVAPNFHRLKIVNGRELYLQCFSSVVLE